MQAIAARGPGQTNATSALVAGILIGSVGAEVARALEKPPAYLVVEYEITD